MRLECSIEKLILFKCSFIVLSNFCIPVGDLLCVHIPPSKGCTMSTVVDVSPRIRRSYNASVTQRHNGVVESHVTDGATRHGGHVTDGACRHGSHVTDGARRHSSHVTDVASRLGGHVANNGSIGEPSVSSVVANESDEDSTAGEGDTVPHESTTTDTIPDPIDPIDFIESHPRSYTEPASNFARHIEERGVPMEEHHRYENWGMQMEEGVKRGGGSKVIKRSKGSRVSKYDRQRMPYPLPKPGKVKTQHTRPSPLARKRRLSGRVLRTPLSNASEGDMAQADEMGEGEGRDDGFVDCPEGMKKRGKKRQGESSCTSVDDDCPDTQKSVQCSKISGM